MALEQSVKSETIVATAAESEAIQASQDLRFEQSETVTEVAIQQISQSP